MQQESPLSDVTPTSTTRESSHHASPASSSHEPRERGGKRARITRKSHRKSRAGCINCKTRRIKCDESKPHCANCIRRHVRCDYPNASAPTSTPTSTPTNHDNAIRGPGSLRISDIELTYHWTTTTCQSLAAGSTNATNWQSVMETVALKNDHVLHLMFALTARHLAYCRPDRKEEYIATAEYHYEAALTIVTAEIADMRADNCDAILTSVQLICFVSWARGPQPGEYLAFGKLGRSEWLVMFRGIKTTIMSVGAEKFTKTHAPAVRNKGCPLPPMDKPPGYEDQLKDLREHIAYVSEPAVRDENVESVDVLEEMYSNRYGGMDGEYHVSFGWLYRMNDAFLDRLQQCDPLALIVYAHFVVLMRDMEKFWYMKGWTHHVMSGIFEALATEHRAWIRWPMTTVGWIAP